METKSESDTISPENELDTELDVSVHKEAAPSAGIRALTANSYIRKVDWPLVATILAIKGLILVFGAASYQLLSNKRIESWRGWLEIWNHWDSLRYVRLAETGYTNLGSYRADLVGFPLYPWLVRAFSFIFQDPLVSGFIVTGLASVAAGLILYKLVGIDQRESVARNAIWFLFIFPTSYYLHINYTESLFLALTLGTFLAARKGNWKIAAALGILTCMTRLNGLVIVPALMFEAIHQYSETRRWQRQWLFIALMPLGFVVHLLVNYNVAGDAFAFISIGRENFHKALSPPWNGITGIYNAMWGDPPGSAIMNGVQELLFVVLGFVCIIACMRMLRPSYTIWITGNWLLFTSVNFILSVPRYTLTLFPIFIIFAKLSERPLWYSIITVWSLLFLALFASQFVRGHWAFG